VRGAFEPFEGHGYVDAECGIFYRRPEGAVDTKKRQPPRPLVPQADFSAYARLAKA
jgi:hypothetical protein